MNEKCDKLREHLKATGISTMIYYPVLLYLQDCFSSLGYREGQLPQSEEASQDVLSLPIFPELTVEERQCVAESITAFF